MSSTISKSKITEVGSKPTSGRLFFLDLGAGRVLSVNPDGSDLKTIVNEGRRLPDGVVVDVAAGHIYWTNMGNPSANDGSIERADLNGRNLTTIVPEGGTFTPKQLQLDKKNGKLYWSDREGMRVMRSNLDGSHIETPVETGHGEADRRDAKNWCVGIALDVPGGKLYWTQKGNDNAGQGRIFRANLEIPKGQTPTNRNDIERLFDGLPEPIDLDLDLCNRIMYWTDRGDPPRGNTVNRAPMDAAPHNIFDKAYAQATAGSTDEHTYVDPDLFTAETPLGTYQGLTDQVVMSRTPGSFRTVLVPRGSCKAEWLES